MSERSLAARLQSAASTQFAGLRAAGRVCTNTSGDAGMKKASTRLLEQETQTPSPAPDLIPAESSTENLHWDWYSKRGHFTTLPVVGATTRRVRQPISSPVLHQWTAAAWCSCARGGSSSPLHATNRPRLGSIQYIMYFAVRC